MNLRGIRPGTCALSTALRGERSADGGAGQILRPLVQQEAIKTDMAERLSRVLRTARTAGCVHRQSIRDLYEIRLVALFLDATFNAVIPDGPKEGVQVGFTEDGERILLAVSPGMRESFEDWQALGRDLISRGLGAPMLIVADGAPGLVKAIEQCWPVVRPPALLRSARRGTCSPTLLDRERERVKHAYWQALDDAISRSRRQAPPPSAH